MSKNIFEQFRVLKESVVKLCPYFVPSYANLGRTVGLFTAMVVVPIANVLIPMYLFRKDNFTNSTYTDGQSNDFDTIGTLASASTVALLSGIQHSLLTFLTTSTMQALKKGNVKLLLDDKSQFLLHGNNNDISSLQYVTVGVGVRDFTGSVIPTVIGLPMYTTSSIITVVNIGVTTKSFATSGIIFGFVMGSNAISYLLEKAFFNLQANNQKIENTLVGKVGFIEAHRSAIPLMGASEAEYNSGNARPRESRY